MDLESSTPSLGELPPEPTDKPEKVVPRRLSCITIAAAGLLFVLLAWLYVFDMQPAARMAVFKKTVAESNSQWPDLEPRLLKLGFRFKPVTHPDVRDIQLCPFQSGVRQVTMGLGRKVPIIYGLVHYIPAPYARINIRSGGRCEITYW